MATTLKTFPPRTKATRYPWHLWLNGSIWTLTLGTDFHVSCKSFQSAAFARSKKLGMKLKTSLSEDSVTLQAMPWSEKKK